jgi:hypothetical protein
MKNLKLLGLAAVAAMALMAFAASAASATALYNGTTKLGVGSTLDFSISSGKSAVLVDTSGQELDKCTGSTTKGKITNAGGATATVSSSNEELTWSGCTFPTTTTVKGGQEIHWINSTEGTVTSNSEISVTINTVFFGSCIYSAKAGTHIGTLTTFPSSPSIMDLNEIVVKASKSNLACPETAKWTGTYTGTEPTNLRVESS